MGTTKPKNGDGHIIFHVGKELPAKGGNLLLVPGVQTAQGRGVYFSDEPRLKYSGGEHFQKKLNITPIYCIPMVGKWIRGKKHKKYGAAISYHSNEKIIALFGLQFFDSVVADRPVRYYYPSQISLFAEPDTVKHGRHVTSRFSDSILREHINFDEAIKQLRENQSAEYKISEEYILQRIKEAIENGRLPENETISKRLLELHAPAKEHERIKMHIQ